MNTYSKLRSRPPADKHEISNVKNWLLHCYPEAIFRAESNYVTLVDDLIRFVEEKKSPLLKKMERYSSITRSLFFKKSIVSLFLLVSFIMKSVNIENFHADHKG